MASTSMVALLAGTAGPAGAVDRRRASLQATLLAAAERHRARDLAAAAGLYRDVLADDPRQPDAVHLLGMVLAAQGEVASGERLVRRSIELRPERAHFHSNLGNLLNRSGRTDAAITAYRHAIELDPTSPDPRANLAGALAGVQRYAEAEKAAEAALELDPDHPTALANLAGALLGQYRFVDAEPPLRRALALDPQNYDVWLNLGHLSMARGRVEESEAAFRRTLELDPGSLEAVKWLGYACVRTRKGEEAERHLRTYLAARPEPSNAHSILGHLCVQRGLFAEGNRLLRTGIERPDAQAAEHSTMIFDLNYDPSIDPVAVRREHERWARRFALPFLLRHPAASTDLDPDRRLRIGFISPDLRGHSVAFFLLPVLRNLAAAEIETFCYSYVDQADLMTAELKAVAGHWRDVWSVPDDEIAARIRADRIDILVDLAGHTSDGRLLVLARRPAPVQATYLGYPNTTGMACVDWRIVDQATDPAEADGYATERLFRLERCFLGYDPVEYPEIVPPPCLERGQVTFGSFNNVAKLNDTVFDVWAAVLAAVPGSRLVLKHDFSHDSVVQQRIDTAFTGRGVAPGRVELLDRAANRMMHLEMYGQVDIALDPFPYNGTTTTCEALWMGVPVVTLAGRTHAGRVGASLLQSVGLHSFVAGSAEDYVLTARELAGAPNLLRQIRTILRGEMNRSPLMDHAGLGATLTRAFRAMWHDHCQRAGGH